MKSNKILFSEAKKYLPGGVNSPYRSFNSVGGCPIFIKRGKGSKIYSHQDDEYIDYSLAWGPMILGHANQKIIKTINVVAKRGWCFGTPTELETIFAKKIRRFFPSMEKIRLTNSGTEAVMGAIRLSRGHTRKNKVIIFQGCYHGHSNDTLVNIENGKKNLTSKGIPKHILQNTLVAYYNDLSSVEALFKKNKDVAAVLLEPVPGNMGVVLPEKRFLQGLRTICRKHNALLIFDEAISGLRVSRGGAQELYKVKPDITVLGKALANGLPIGVFGGKKEIMNKLSPEGKVYTGGTFSGNPLTVSCGITTLNELSKDNLKNITSMTKNFCEDLKKFVKDNDVPVVINYIGSMFSLFFSKRKNVSSSYDVLQCDRRIFSEYFHYLLKNGIYVSPSSWDASFVSTAHTNKDLERTAKVIKGFLLKTFKQK